MIVQESLLSTLNQTAKKYGLTTKRSLKREKVVNIVIKPDGSFVGVEKGEALVPRGVFADNEKNHARFLIERMQKALLLSSRYESQHVEFKKQLVAASAEMPKSKLGSVVKFLKRVNAPMRRRIHEQIQDLCDKKANPFIAFVEYHRNGNLPCFDNFAQAWWKKEYRRQLQERFKQSFRGICQITGKKQIIPNCTPMPIDRRTGTIISANWKAAEFGGYNGLESSHIGLDAAVDISLALEHVDGNLLKYQGKDVKSSFWIDDTHRIWSWFCDPSNVNENDMTVIEQSLSGDGIPGIPKETDQESLSYIDWIREQYCGNEDAMRPDKDSVFCTVLVAKNPGESRLVILEHSFLTTSMLRQNILQWYDDLHIESRFRKKSGTKLIQRPPMSVKKAMRVLFDNPGKGAMPSHICRSIHSAFFHGRAIRSQHLHRLNSRVVKAVITQRYFWDFLSLLKLSLIRKGIDVPKTWTREKAESSIPYVVGSILFLTAYAQHPKSKGRDSIVPKRYLAWCSTNPARAFARFSHMFEIYLDRMRRESPGLAWWLLRARGYLLGLVGDFPNSLSPTERSELLLGFGLMREVLQSYKFEEVFPNLKTKKENNDG